MKKKIMPAFTGLFMVGMILSFLFHIEPGIDMARTFRDFFLEMLKIFPPAFILIGLFEVWVRRDVVEKHLGEKNRIRGFLWAVVLASITMTPFIMALPVGRTLLRKGAAPSVILSYLALVGVCRIPMTLFEVSYLGFLFTATRWVASILLIFLCMLTLGKHMDRRENLIPEDENRLYPAGQEIM